VKSVRAKRRGGQPRQQSPRRDGDDQTGDEGVGSTIVRLALAHWPAAAVLIAEDGDITAGNRAAARLFGYQPRDLQKLAVDELIPAWRPLDRGDPPAVRRRATGHRLDGSTFPLRFIQLPVDTDDTRCTLVAIRPRVHSGNGHVSQVRNRHSEARLRAALRAARIQISGATVDDLDRESAEHALHHAQKIEALGTLAGGIAHDFNNILLAIAGNTRLAKQELSPEHPIQNMLGEIAKASARATDLVDRILTFSRQNDCRREILQLQPTVEEAIKLLRATLPAMIEINTNFAEGLPPVRADATQIHQIMVNLVTNSAHAIGDGAAGCITVSLDEAYVTQGGVLAPELHGGRYIRLSVTDTGTGIDKATLERVFDPFFTTKPVGRGTGLGLSVVDGIMRSHEGSVIATSEPGRGATFRLYFPAVDAAPAQEQSLEREIAPPAVQGRGRRVMYIDDEDSLVYLMTRVLQKSGYRVTGFTDAEQALQTLRAAPDEFDVIVTDLSMPGMSGFHVAQAIREIRAELPVVVTSGYVRAEDREIAKEVGVRALVLKPNTIEELAGVLARVFEG
jgi:PAS domain S-box-containing protein